MLPFRPQCPVLPFLRATCAVICLQLLGSQSQRPNPYWVTGSVCFLASSRVCGPPCLLSSGAPTATFIEHDCY